MANDERKDRKDASKPENERDEHTKDLAAKKLESDKEEQVKGGRAGFRPIADEM